MTMRIENVNTEQMTTTREFWNASPCGGLENLEEREKLRYDLEPYIPKLLERIAGRHSQVVEIGCGQGTDGLYLCRHLPADGSYTGLDYSQESVQRANAAVRENKSALRVQPHFEVGNAEQLPLADGSVECIYSLGVIHHTADVPAAIAGVLRVLKPGGRAYILLYRKWSPKVTIAKALRAFQLGLDKLFGTDRCIYRIIHGNHAERWLGTMLLECFGVPYMKWYNRREMLELFAPFKVNDLTPYSFNLPWLNKNNAGPATFGYLWLAEVEKR